MGPYPPEAKMVNEGERDKSKFEAVIKAMELADYVLNITDNEKNFKPGYLTDLIRGTAMKIFLLANHANEIKVEDEDDRAERLRSQKQAIRAANDLLALIQMSRKTFHLTSKRIKYWGGKTVYVRNAIHSWHKGDIKRYPKQ